MPVPQGEWGAPLLTPLLLISALSVSAQVSVIVDREVNAKLGSDAKLNCKVKTPDIISQVTWQRKLSPNNENFLTYSKGEEPMHLTPFGQRVKFLGNGDLGGSIRIPNVTLADQGTYLCIFTTFPGGTKEAEIKLVIQVPPKITLEPTEPVLSGPSPSPIAVCRAWAAKPAVNITWIFSEARYISEENSTNYENGTVSTCSQLVTVPLPGHNGRNVTCVVSQSDGKSMESWSQTLTIQHIYYAPEVKAKVIAKDDGTIQLSCRADCNPPATEFLWKRDEMDLPDNEAEELGATRLLSANTWKGYYACVAGNEVGYSSGYIYVQTVTGTCNVHYIPLILLIPSLLINIYVAVIHYRNKKRERYRNSECCLRFRSNCTPILRHIQRLGCCGEDHAEAPTDDAGNATLSVQRDNQHIDSQGGPSPSSELGGHDRGASGAILQCTSMTMARDPDSSVEDIS
ncbi:uncharacterized protein LOC100145297 isoform X2 [Xenopus tropicalis]|uniref:Uncharacterized protein LOC100145297 isoform X2 n=1 Tax=Xenopus tropicalis TaxID=8364 RepID=A0A8J1J384_XENTR|nr:uncharacterized protein LOC100145297 isoform X2 [Xenopus tropicalis]